jgi:hypothetical protein
MDERRSAWNCEHVGTRKTTTIYIYEEHQTHRSHCWRHRPRRRSSTNTASNSPGIQASLIAAPVNAKKPQTPERQALYDGPSAYTRHTGVNVAEMLSA